MTYGLALQCGEGLVFLSDCRSSAGVDNITVQPKMHVFSQDGDRVLCILVSGNLSISQSVLSLVEQDLASCQAGTECETILNRTNLYDTARYLGVKTRQVEALDAGALRDSGLSFNVNFILGGQIRGQPPQIYQIYPEGNAIHASRETPFLQIGELKYGKPILDRGFNYDTTLPEAVKFGILSLDATAKSNLSVGTPFDLFRYRTDSFVAQDRMRLDDHHPYLCAVRDGWQEGIIRLVREMPELEFTP